MSSSKRLMEWIDEEEGVPVEEVVKLSEEDITYAQTQFGVQGCSETFRARRKFLDLIGTLKETRSFSNLTG